MPSFDIVSKVDSMEIENAINQAKKELSTRFDFRGSKAEITLDKHEIKLTAENAFKIRALEEIVVAKLTKRNIDPKSIDRPEPDVSPLGHARQTIKIKQGIDHENGKLVSQFIRGLGLKTTCQIQDQQIRVTGKSRDDLQAVIAAIRGHDFPVALGFLNFRD